MNAECPPAQQKGAEPPASGWLDGALSRHWAARLGGARRWRRGGGFWLVYLFSPLGSAWTDHRLAASIAGTVLLVAFAAAYLFVVPLAWWGRGGRRVGVATVSLMFALGLACAAVIGPNGLTTFIFAVAAMIVTLPHRVALPAAAMVALLTLGVPQFIPPWHVQGPYCSVGVAVALPSVAIFSFSSLVRANLELAAAREEVAQLAAERERLRIARDLHDLLGHSLTTVTVKAALASRLIDTDPARAKQEVGEVERLARESLADTRNAVTGYRDVRLATELATAREVLAAAGIDADLPKVVDHVAADLGGLFGWVVREGVTNVVRHSRARRVSISLDGGRDIEIVDDGRGIHGDVDGNPGHGLAGLTERAAALGGRVTTGPAGLAGAVGGFRLRVEVP
jgi:two-component system sensor histidine kinase DesK